MHEQREPSVLIRDFLIFQLKLALDGLKDVVVFQLSIGAAILDLILTSGRRPRWFYRVVRLSERWDLWLNLHGAVAGADTDPDGLFGRSAAGSDTLLGQIEELALKHSGKTER